MIVAASNDKTVKLWKTDGSLLKPLSGHEGTIRRVAFSPDGSMIATASDDKTVKLWKRDGTLAKTLSGHQGKVLDVAFSPDGKTVASASEDRTVMLWNWQEDLSLGRRLAHACQWMRDYLANRADAEDVWHLCQKIFQENPGSAPVTVDPQ